MTAPAQAFKRLDAVSGESAEFDFKDNETLIGKFVITGTAGEAIMIFEAREDRGSNTIFKAKCEDWAGAIVTLHLKTTHEDDDFSETRVVFAENDAKYSVVR